MKVLCPVRLSLLLAFLCPRLILVPCPVLAQQAAAPVSKCSITFESLTKRAGREGTYRVVIKIGNQGCGEAQDVSIGLTPLCGGEHVWAYSGGERTRITAGESRTFDVTVSLVGGKAGLFACRHRFRPATCGDNCPSSPAFRDSEASAYQLEGVRE